MNLSADKSDRLTAPLDVIIAKSVSTNSLLCVRESPLIQLLNASLSILLVLSTLFTVSNLLPHTCHDIASCCIIPVWELFTIIYFSSCSKSMPTTECSGTIVLIFGNICLYSSLSIISRSKPGPSLLYTAIILLFSDGFAFTAAYIARFPPFE